MLTSTIKVVEDGKSLKLYGVPESDKAMMKNFFAATYSDAKRYWKIPRNRFSTKDLYKAYPTLRSDSGFLQLGEKIQAEYKAQMEMHKTLIIPPKAYEGELKNLRPYQREDAIVLSKLKRAGVFNDPRTGKTPTTIATLRLLNLKKNLVACPASLLYNWKQEFAAWWPECVVYVYDGTPKQMAAALNDWQRHWLVNETSCVLIMSKNQVSKISKVDGYYSDSIIVDEAHFLRNYNTAQSKDVVAQGMKAEYRYALTGTPTVKHPSDMFGIMRFLFPEEYTSYWQLAGRYFYEDKNRATDQKQAGDLKPYRKEEFQELSALISRQRKRKDVMPWLPDKERSQIPIRMSSKQRKLYDDMKKWFVAMDETNEVDAANIISQLMRMRQLCQDPRLLEFEEKGAKTKAILEYLDNNREPIVVMSMFTSYLKLLKNDIVKLGLKVGEINGTMSATDKAKAASAFQAGKIDILLCNVISAGTGFTLDRSSTVVFLDTAWNPSENEQAEDRVCPTDPSRNHKHSIINFVCEDSVDERMLRILEKKKDLTEYINSGGWRAAKGLV